MYVTDSVTTKEGSAQGWQQRGAGLGGGGLLTVKSRAGIGVQRFTWIMANTLGRWPSLAPAKNSLAGRKVGQPGLACAPLSRATLIVSSFGPHSSPLHRLGTCLCVHALWLYVHKCRHRQTRGNGWVHRSGRGETDVAGLGHCHVTLNHLPPPPSAPLPFVFGSLRHIPMQPMWP